MIAVPANIVWGLAAFVLGVAAKQFWDLFLVKEDLKREVAGLRKLKIDLNRAHDRIRTLAEHTGVKFGPVSEENS